MTDHDEAAWQAEFDDGLARLDRFIRVLRWIGALVALYIIGSIGAALWVTA